MYEMNQPNPSQQNAQPPMSLPYSSAALVLGIISIVSFCCCSFIGIVLGIIGIVLGNKSAALYQQSPGVYTESSFKNANAGKICSIIGLVLCVLSILLLVAFWKPYMDMITTIIDQYGF